MEEIRRALTTTDNGVVNVITEDLEPTLIDYLYNVSPLINLVTKKRADGKTHEVALRTAVPEAWVEGELTPPTYVGSTYARKSVQMKIVRISGGVSHFAQSSAQFLDLLQQEILVSVKAVAKTLEFMNFWGNATADAYQWDGIDTLINANGSSVIDWRAEADLTLLDNMIDSLEQIEGLAGDEYIFVASPQMISKFSALETRVGVDLVSREYEGGLRLRTYRGIPFVPAFYVRATAASPTPVVTVAGSGSLGAGVYNYKIASVTRSGEQVVGTSDDGTSAGAALTLTWTADSTAKLYKIYRTAVGVTPSTDADYSLLTTVAAKTYDGTGAVSGNVTTFVDNGSYTLNTDVHPLGAGEETVWLLDLNPLRGISMLYLENQAGTGTAAGNWIRFWEIGKNRSAYEYSIETFNALQLPQPETCVVARAVTVE